MACPCQGSQAGGTPLQADSKIGSPLPSWSSPKPVPSPGLPSRPGIFNFFPFSVMLEGFGQKLVEQGRSKKALKQIVLWIRRAPTPTHNTQVGFPTFSTEISISGRTRSLAISSHFAKSRESSARTATGAFFKCHFKYFITLDGLNIYSISHFIGTLNI